MALKTSSRFACVHSSGSDWRDVSRSILTEIEKILIEETDFNLGFIYITDNLAEDAESILTLLKSITHIENWVGSTGIKICGNNTEYMDEPAIAVMLGNLKPEEFCMLLQSEPDINADINSQTESGEAKNPIDLAQWLENSDPLLSLVHGIPMKTMETANVLAKLEQQTVSFITGGLSSARGKAAHISNTVSTEGFSGIIFSNDLQISTMLSQGCAPISASHTITKCQDGQISELDNKSAFAVLSEDMQHFIGDKTEEDIQRELDSNNPDNAFKGEVHVAFPVVGSEDQNDYLVRNILDLDVENETLTVAHDIAPGDRLIFVHRDQHTLQADLTTNLLSLRERIIEESGHFKPTGAIYISCSSRALADLNDQDGAEIGLLNEILGDIPIIGFSASGEISNARLYGYSGVLILFL